MSAHLSLSAQSLQLSCAPGAVSSSQVSSTSTISVPGAHGERSALQLRHRLFPVPHVRQRTEVDRTPLRSRGIPARKGVLTALVLVLRLRSSPCEVRRHAMSSIQSTMRTCTRGASGAGVSVPAARGIPNSRAPSCHLERACRLRLAAGTRAAPQRSWHFLRTLSVSVIGSSGAGMSLKPSVPGSGRLWDPPSHAGRPCGTPARACTASAWMDQIRGEAVRLMSSEGSAAVYILFV